MFSKKLQSKLYEKPFFKKVTFNHRNKKEIQLFYLNAILVSNKAILAN